ncbi:hypothetical protein [Chitinibacter tainanensis]|uniref:hypothetical protein n=1 Tax=Chitinibacter tainanensis TaxID=230667 RepID=UPI002357CC3B|nr:hypothetical protein [Chitinibacter tainanensis]
MPTAQNYSPTADFSQDETVNASGRSTVNTTKLDTEFANIATSFNALNGNLQKLQRDDGKLADYLVEPYNLSDRLRSIVCGGWNPRGNWAANTQYSPRDFVLASGLQFVCIAGHKSGSSFGGDNAFWMAASSAIDASNAAAQANASAVSAASSASAASTSASAAANSATAASSAATAAGDSANSASNSATSAASSASAAGSSATSAAENASIAINAASSVYGVAGRNIIINGDMSWDQERVGAVVTPATTGALAYVLDQVALFNSQASKITSQQVADAPVGFSKSLKLVVASAVTPLAADYFQCVLPIEGSNAIELAWGAATGRAVTLQFRIKASVTGTFAGCIRNGSALNRSYLFTYVVSSTGWAVFSVTIPADVIGSWATDNARAFDIVFDLGSGSNFNGTANTWQAGNQTRVSGSINWIANTGATWQITGVKLEAGSVATPWTPHWGRWGGEQQAALRYYQRFTLSVVGTGNVRYVTASSILRAPMRSAPTLITRDNAGTAGMCSVDAANGVSAVMSSFGGSDSVRAQVNNVLVAVDSFVVFNCTADARM